MTDLLSSRRGLLAAVLSVAALGGCALLNTFHAEVASFGNWASERQPGSYRFERLPSQAAQPDNQQALEDAAAHALEKAGFVRATDDAKADVVVQVGARVSSQMRSPWDDPLWGRWSLYGRSPSRVGWGWPVRWDMVQYEREAALLIRDAKSGEPLYETRARSQGGTPGSNNTMQVLYMAALAEFPRIQSEPHNVAVVIP